MAQAPQFPLSMVLFPGMVLPLHVFEPRYRTMIDAVLAEEGTFGVVLIERGHEVGGSDTRCNVGTTAKVVKAERFDDGRWALLVAGVERYRVLRWLEDDPYPRADIEIWPDEGSPQMPSPELVAAFNRCRMLASEAGLDVGQIPPALKDQDLDCLQMAALAPLATYDRQRLLAVPGPSERVPMLKTMLDDAIELIELRLSSS